MFETFMNTISGLLYGVLHMIGIIPVLENCEEDTDTNLNGSPSEELLQTIQEMNRTIKISKRNTNPDEETLLFRFRTYVNACVMTVVHSADYEIVNDAMDRLNTMRSRLHEQYNVIIARIPSVDDCVNKIIILSQSVVKSKKSEN